MVESTSRGDGWTYRKGTGILEGRIGCCPDESMRDSTEARDDSPGEEH